MNRPYFQNSRLIAANATHLTVAKTLGSTGELDLWSGSGAMVIPAGGELSIVSSSAQDSALVTDTWTISAEVGTDFAATITLDDVAYSCVPLGPDEEFSGLDDAMANGSKEAWAVLIATCPDPGDIITIAVAGGSSYPLTITSETTPDECATALAALMAADAVYDVAAPGSGSGAVALIAKTGNTNTGAVSVTLSDTGDASASQIVTHGPPCTTHSATVVGSSLVIRHLTGGVASVLTADTDNISAAHTLTGGAGSGLQTIRVHYLTATGLRKSETLTMTGTAAVTTDPAISVTGFLGAESVAGTAAGTITITRFGGGTVSTIAVGDSETHNLYAATGAGSDSFTCTGLSVSNGSGTVAAIRLRSTGPDGAKLLGQWAAGIGTNLDLDFGDSPIVLGPSSTIKATAEGNGAVLFVSLNGYYGG